MKKPLTITKNFQFNGDDQVLAIKMSTLLPVLADILIKQSVLHEDSNLPADLCATAELLDRLVNTAFDTNETQDYAG